MISIYYALSDERSQTLSLKIDMVVPFSGGSRQLTRARYAKGCVPNTPASIRGLVRKIRKWAGDAASVLHPAKLRRYAEAMSENVWVHAHEADCDSV